MEREQILSQIIKLELEQCELIFNGLKPSTVDVFSEKRKELILLRCLYFGYNSENCKIKKGS